MVVGVGPCHFLNAHAGIGGGCGLETAVFVSGLEDKRGLMLIDAYLGRGHAQRLAQGHFRIVAAVLLNHYGYVVERVGDIGALGVDLDRQLLVRVVVVDIGYARQPGRYAGALLRHHEAALEPCVVGVVLGIYTQQVVARYAWRHLLVGYCEPIVDIVHGRDLGEGVIVD